MEIVKTKLVANKYILHNEIGKGKFGIVYNGEHFKNKTKVAIKMEHCENSCNTIKYEATILNYLHKNGCRIIPSVFWYGVYENFKCLVMDYYDQTIEQYLQIKSQGSLINRIALSIRLLVNMVGILGQIHKQQIIHRDIKPENFMIKNGEMHIIDFGIASAVECIEEINSEPNRTTIIGSPKYISFFIHQGYEPMYRDDLISAGYCFLWFIMGTLHWSNIHITNENIVQQVYPEIHVLHPKNQLRKQQKEWKNIEQILYELKQKYLVHKCSQIFDNAFEYFSLCYNLQFTEQPFYEELCQVLLTGV